MAHFIAVLLPLPLLVFWAWMFAEMAGNQDLPPCFISVTNGENHRLDWNLAFIAWFFVAAVFYYLNVYRYRYR